MTHFPAMPLRPARPSWIERAFAVAFAFAFEVPIRGWALMVLMGVLHHEVAPSVPAIGFGLAALLGVLLGVVLDTSSSNWIER